MDAQAQTLTYPKSFSFPKLSLKLGLSKFLQMRLNSFLFRFLPFAVSRFYLLVLGRLYYFINRKEKKMIERTIRYCFRRQNNEAAVNAKVKETFRGIIDHYHEKLYVGYSHFPRLLQFLRTRVRIEGQEELHKALAEGNGVLLVTGHFGAVEFLPGALALNGYPTSMICRFQTNRLRTTLGQRAEAVGLNIIDADDGNIILTAMKALKQGQILITECDEFDEWRTDPKRQTRFLGNKLDADRTLELLKKRSGATVISALVRRDGHRRYTCKLTPIVDAANIPVGEQCLQILESAVESDPEQWYQWKKLGKMIKPRIEVKDENQKCRYLDPEVAIPLADQA